MINWKDVELTDKEAIENLICASGCHGADYGFANLFMWRHAYNPKIFFAENRLLIGNPEWEMYGYPKGDGDVKPSIELLKEDAHSRNKKLIIRGLTDKTLDEFLSIYNGQFEISEDRDNADYIYTADKLCNLSGRKLSSKRNHINKFEKNGNWKLEKIEQSNMQVAKDFLSEFYKEKHDPDLNEEAVALNELFENFDALEAIAALLFQNDRPIAFSAGTTLGDDVFDVHFEKALPNVEGAYTMINREFARLVVSEHPNIGAFNREEDMGIEGLRKAKLSYHPDILLMKYIAKEI
ncbi:MAG: phosphatidylglycerol lysyltransferase domain-containing protein [Alphaproteobacteria bacterium]|nr:phosphatidylglycerol lysyltransferase domain-containing protein [Alphaproteobacteria bacterium]